jgi:putative oxidoreductase
MSQSRLSQLGSLVLRLLVGGTFALAALLKLRDPAAFAEQTGNYQFMPELSNYIAITLPSIELTTAVVLILGPRLWRHGASLVFGGLLVVFTTAIARAWAMGINLECGCFGEGSTSIGPWPILRNLGLLTAILLAWWFERRAALGASAS